MLIIWVLLVQMYHVSLDGDLIWYSYLIHSHHVTHSIFYKKRLLNKRLRGANVDYSIHCGRVWDVSNWVGFNLTHGLWIVHMGYLISEFNLNWSWYKLSRSIVKLFKMSGWVFVGSPTLVVGFNPIYFKYSYSSQVTMRLWDKTYIFIFCKCSLK